MWSSAGSPGCLQALFVDRLEESLSHEGALFHAMLSLLT